MKVALSELSGFLSDPEAWAERAAKTSAGGARHSFAHTMVMAAYHFHKSGDAVAAKAALLEYLDSFNLTNANRRATTEEQLNSYIIWVDKYAPIVIGHRVRVRVDLGAGLYTGGEIHRIDLDLKSGGYRAVMLGADITGSADPRAAVLQEGYADLSGRSPELIIPTNQNLDGSSLAPLQIPKVKREATMEALRAAAAVAAKRFGKHR